MDGNGQPRNDAAVLHWPRGLLSADDVARRVNGHRELILPARAVVTPLAAEELRAKGVRLLRQQAQPKPEPVRARWGYAQERPHAMVQSAVQALRREGVTLKELEPAAGDASPCRWAKALAECVASGECHGGLVFCQDPGLLCCVANKVGGLRAVAVCTVAQAARAALTLSANLVAVEMPGRTFFEIRQMFRILCQPGAAVCPDGVACTLRELDGHAHR